MSAASPTRRLVLGKKHAAFRSTLGGSRHGGRIGRANLVVMMKVMIEDGATKQRQQNFWKQKIGDRLEPISGCGMSGHVHAETAQLLVTNRALADKLGINGTPHFIIDDKVIPGAPDNLYDQLAAIIGDVRKNGCKFC